jgi:hypothetical protein
VLAELRARSIEPPTPDRVEKVVRSGLHQAEKILAEQIAGRLPSEIRARLLSLVAVVDTDVDDADPSVLALIKAATGNVSLSSMLTEISRLEAVRAIGLPAGLFADVASKVLAAWRTRAAVESPSHLRDHSVEVTLTLLRRWCTAAAGRSPMRWSRCCCARCTRSRPAPTVGCQATGGRVPSGARQREPGCHRGRRHGRRLQPGHHSGPAGGRRRAAPAVQRRTRRARRRPGLVGPR